MDLLTGTTITSANLTGASVTEAQLEFAIGNDNTILPPGMNRPKAWLNAK